MTQTNVIKLQEDQGVQTALTGNVTRCATALERVLHRPASLPGMAVFYGPSGWGKSFAARWVAQQYDCYYLQARSNWNTKAMLVALTKVLGIQPHRTSGEMVDQIIEHLTATGRGLVIDEFDHAVQLALVEAVRDIYDGAEMGLLIVGEEALPQKLRQWERFHGRVLDWLPAQPVGMDDVRALRDVYATRVNIAEDLLAHVLAAASGSVRRIVVNLHLIENEALRRGVSSMALAQWGDQPLFVGDAPKRRVG
jgi:hypothetical protein